MTSTWSAGIKEVEMTGIGGRNSQRRGFTLIELIVVILIILLLIGILIPVLSYAKRLANNSATAATLQTISTGLENYATGFNHTYPASTPSSFSGGVNITRGSVMLVQGLDGFLDYSQDGAGISNPGDPAYGFRTTPGGKGQIYQPFVPPDQKLLK